MGRNRVCKLIILICMITLFSTITGCGKSEDADDTTYAKQSYNSREVLKGFEIQEDLEFIRDKIVEVHPDAYNYVDKNKFSSEWKKLIDDSSDSMTYEETYFKVLKGMNLVNDINTTISFNDESNHIPLEFIWKENGAWVTEKINYLEVGDKIIKIGNKSMEDILISMREIFTDDNEFSLMLKGSKELKNKYLLKKLGIIDIKNNRVKIEAISINNQSKIAYLNFEEKFQEDAQNPDEFYSYKIFGDKKLAVLKLDKCNNDENYRSMLYKFFMECFEKDVKYIALDLRNNNGGDISVLDDFLKYTTISKYRTYDVKYKSSKEAKNRGMKNKLFKSRNVKIKHEDGKLYDGELMVLTSYGTKNEANMIAAIFKENNLGKIIGECTGSSPNAYGKSIEFITPNLGMSFSISTAECITPYKDNLNENTLRPDIYVNSDGKEVVNNTDSTIDWLKNNLN